MLGIQPDDVVMDYGCATGCLTKSLLRYTPFVYGTDISKWAIDYGIKNLKLKNNIFHYNKSLLCYPNDYVIMLDVLEHCTDEELSDIFHKLSRNVKLNKIVVRIPVSVKEGYNYFLPVSQNDRTHIQVHCKKWWREFFKKYGFKVCDIMDSSHIYNSAGVLAWVIKK